MKKVFSVLMVASVLSLVACKGNKTEETTTATDSPAVETPAAETPATTDSTSMTADSAKAETPAEGEKKAEEHKEVK